jgi:osmotically-inducible protein OsmY
MIFKPQQFHGEKPVVAGKNPTEAKLEQRVADALAASDGTGSEGLKVVASGSEIFLFGEVSFRNEIDRAVEVALAVPGVEKVTVSMHSDEAP